MATDGDHGCAPSSLDLAAAAVAAVVLLWREPALGQLALPFLFAAAVGGTWYGVTLTQRITDPTPPMPLALFLALSGLMAITMFWMTERVATVGAEARVQTIKQDPAALLSPVILYTDRQLPNAPTTLTETHVGADDSAGYRYDGGYLLQRSGGSYFLLIPGATLDERLLVLIPEAAVSRLEFRSGQ